jgi:hypothetical protein
VTERGGGIAGRFGRVARQDRRAHVGGFAAARASTARPPPPCSCAAAHPARSQWNCAISMPSGLSLIDSMRRAVSIDLFQSFSIS